MNIVFTGSSSGIGQAATERLLLAGHAVWGLARSDQASRSSGNGAFRATRCDVSAWDEVDRAAREVASQWGSIDALIACAGIHGEVGPALSADPLRWSETVRANLDGTFFALRAFAPLLKKAPRRAKVICFSGGGATRPRPRFSAYGAAKTAIVRLVETVAEEEKDSLLDINALAPGAINTRLTEEVIRLGPQVVGETEFQAALRQRETGGGSIEKVHAALAWLLSPGSDGISGRLIAAQWDDLPSLAAPGPSQAAGDRYTLRRINPIPPASG